jgi:hypothetical protein
MLLSARQIMNLLFSLCFHWSNLFMLLYFHCQYQLAVVFFFCLLQVFQPPWPVTNITQIQ